MTDVSPINCIIVDDESTAREVLECHLKKIDFVNILASCKNAIEAFNAINSHKIHIIFLDINMPEISGLSFAKSIHPEIKIIFTTAYREYAVEGFDLRAVDYLLKPISMSRLIQALEKYRNETITVSVPDNKLLENEVVDHIFVRSDRKMIKVCFKDILYLESIGDYVKIHMDKKSLLTRDTISNIETRLPATDFLRIHRSYLVAVSKIESFTNEIIGIGNKELPISRSYKDFVLDSLNA